MAITSGSLPLNMKDRRLDPIVMLDGLTWLTDCAGLGVQSTLSLSQDDTQNLKLLVE